MIYQISKKKLSLWLCLTLGSSLLLGCQSSGGFDEEAVNQRGNYREDEIGFALPNPKQVAEEYHGDGELSCRCKGGIMVKIASSVQMSQVKV